jgi:hypothetical protein
VSVSPATRNIRGTGSKLPESRLHTTIGSYNSGKMPKSLTLLLLLVLASVLHSQDSHRHDSPAPQLPGPNGATFARDKAGEDVVAESLTKLLAEQRITGLSRYYPTLLSEGVCSSILKGSWVSMIKTDEGPSAFYRTDDISQPSNELRQMAVDTALHYVPMKRYAVAVWKENLTSGSSRYWVGVVLAKSSLSDWLGSRLGADSPQESFSPNGPAERDVSPECRHK